MADLKSSEQNRLPPGMAPLDHQIAGHLMQTMQKNAIAFLKPNKETLLKLMQLPPRGQCELKFYQTLFDDQAGSDSVLKRLREFLPKFYGTWKLDIFPDETYIHLEDLTIWFNKPCIADIKIGSQTYSPNATYEKIQYEKVKSQFSKLIGFKMGFRVYRPSTDTFYFACRKTLLQMDQFRMLREGIGEYFNLSESLRKDAIFAILLELMDIKAWFESQRKYAFYSSSLLCIYEGIRPCNEHLLAVSNHLSKNNNGSSTTSIEDFLSNTHVRHACVKVKMIDFGHVFTTCERDDNYISGLDNLINYLKILLLEF
ncbi:inositol polyphosphate multikinase-like [Argonauta hians]